MIQIIPFDLATMLPLLESLHQTHNWKQTQTSMLGQGMPQTGYVALVAGQPGAAGFLRMVEGGFAMIDTLVSNADLGSEARHMAITAVVDALINHAKTSGIKGIVAHTKDKGILKRAKTLGFKKLSEQIITIKL